MYVSFVILHVVLYVLLCYFFYKKNNSGVFNPLFWVLVFHGVVFVLKPALNVIFDFGFAYIYMGFFPTDAAKIKSLLVADIWFVTTYILMLDSFKRKLPTLDYSVSPSDRYVAKLVILLFLPLALYSTLITFGGVAIDGSSGSIVMERVDGIAINVDSVGYVNDAKSLLVGIVILSLAVWKPNKWNVALTALFFILRLYEGWGRWAIVFTIFSLALFFLYKHKRKGLKISWIFWLIPMFMAFTGLSDNRDMFKEALGNHEEKPVVNYTLVETNRFDTLDFANFEYLTFIVNIIPERTGSYTYGTQYLQLLTEPIPRKFWPGKPVGAPVKFFNINNYGNFIGLTYSMPGDFWASGGFIGVFILSILFGSFLSKVHLWFINKDGDIKVTVLYLIFLPLLLQWMRDGGIVSIMKFFLFTMLPIITWRFLSSIKGVKSYVSRKF